MKQKILNFLSNIRDVFNILIYPISLWVLVVIALWNRHFDQAIFWAIMILIEEVRDFKRENKEE